MAGSNIKCEYITFPVLNLFSGGMIQVGNLFLHKTDLPIGLFRSFFTLTHQMLRFAHAAFGGSHVGLSHFRQAIDAMQALFLVTHAVPVSTDSATGVSYAHPTVSMVPPRAA